jgi:hypothetical protein
MKNTIIFVLGCISILVSCTEMTEPKLEPKQQQKPYMTLQIGDIRQYYSTGNGMFMSVEITDTIRRTDNQKMYVTKNNFYTLFGYYTVITYSFIRDGYFWESQLDTLESLNAFTNNPYIENKIMSIYPKDGESFYLMEGAPDSINQYRKLKYIGSFITPLKIYEDVVECEIITSDSSIQLHNYYSPEFGIIGMVIKEQNDSTTIYPVYLKVGDREFGNYIYLPEKKLIKLPQNDVKKHSFIGLENFLFK